MAGGVLAVSEVASQVIAAIDDDRLYVLPHPESRPFIQRRFSRIDASFND
jgi:hypothetical protein